MEWKDLITRRSHGCLWCYLPERQSSGQGCVKSGLLAAGLGWLCCCCSQITHRGKACWCPERFKPGFYLILLVFKPTVTIFPLFGCYKKVLFLYSLLPSVEMVRKHCEALRHHTPEGAAALRTGCWSHCSTPTWGSGSPKSTQVLVWHRDEL